MTNNLEEKKITTPRMKIKNENKILASETNHKTKQQK
jgi:hypothetical protein